MTVDLLVRGGTVVTAAGEVAADVAVVDGRIVAVEERLADEAREVVDASGLHVFPGGVDSHVHFNDPGRTEWETLADGSAALAAGGCTTFVDMPLNNRPVTVDGAAFDLKLEAASRSAAVDFGLWAGLVPGNLERLGELAARGALGFKAFMSPSGIDEFPACDEATLLEGMKRIAALGSILLVHAEDPSLLAGRAGAGDPQDFVRSRPPEAEVRAIERAIEMSRTTGCRLHVVHVSTARGAELVHQAGIAGVDVTAETCPHYLLYTAEDLDRMGARGKCAPPFRSASDREALWQMLADGRLPMVVSDHSPCTLDLKQTEDFFAAWGGISGCQSTRQILLAQDRLPVSAVAAVTATNVARRFGLAGKGELAAGFDADMWLVDLGWLGTVHDDELLYRNRFSAHAGRPIRGRTVRTILRGRSVYPGRSSGGRFIPAGGRR